MHKMALHLGKKFQCVLQSGLSPGDLALTLCLGGAIGILPLPWGTSLLCILLASRLKLNHAVMQGVNYLVYPIQIACCLPFVRIGAACFPFGPVFSLQAVRTILHGPLSGSLSLIGWLALLALVGWLLTVPLSCFLLYPVLLKVFSRRTSAEPGIERRPG